MRQAQTLNEARCAGLYSTVAVVVIQHVMRPSYCLAFKQGCAPKRLQHSQSATCLMKQTMCAHSSFSAQHKARVGTHALCISISACVRHLETTARSNIWATRSARCLRAKRAGTSQPTPCASCSSTSTKRWVSKMHQAIREGALTLPDWPTRE